MGKGITFSLLFLLLVSPIVTTIIVNSILTSGRVKQLSVEVRVNEINRFLYSILRDYKKSIKIIMPRAISSAISYVVSNGEGLDAANLRLEELALNGTLFGNEEILMENATIPYWINEIKAIGSTRKIETDIQLIDFKVMPYDSWNLLINSTIKINMTASDVNVSIIKNVTIEEKISVEGFEDPVFVLYTLGRGTNIIKKSKYLGNYTKLLAWGEGNNSWFRGESVVVFSSSEASTVQNKSQKVLVIPSTSGTEGFINNFGAVVTGEITGSVTIPYVVNSTATSLIPNNTFVLVDGSKGYVWFIENLRDDIENSYYHPSLNGSSFLDRLEGKLFAQEKYKSQTSNIIGLESFIDKLYMLSLGLTIEEEKTNIDYLYFSGSSVTSYRIKGIDTYFRIDNETSVNGETHLLTYGVNELVI